jgi:hypothetical protein
MVLHEGERRGKIFLQDPIRILSDHVLIRSNQKRKDRRHSTIKVDAIQRSIVPPVITYKNKKTKKQIQDREIKYS